VTGQLADDAVVDLFPLHIGAQEDGAYEVGRPDTGVFVALPPEGVDLVTWFAEGTSVREVKERFTARYGLAPELEDFVDGIGECGFVRQITATATAPHSAASPAPGLASSAGPAAIGPAAAGETARGILLLGAVSPARLQWLLSTPAKLAFAGLWLTVPVILVAEPALAPRPSDALLTSNVLLNALLIAVIAWTLVLAHEFAHALAARAVGCTGRLSISRRMWFLVGQTELADVRTVPRRRRYAPYLAGMTWDLTVILGCLSAELAGATAQLPRTVIYTLCLTLIYQFSVFMRTDIYYVIANWLRLGDLMGDTRHLVANVTRQLLGQPPQHDLTGVPDRELRIIRWYAVYYIAGSALVTAGFLLLSIPAVIRMTRIAVAGISAGPTTAGGWEGTGFLALVLFQFGTLAFVSRQERRQQRANPRPAQ
jgi:putative peptide zinc metalloprotease protein